MFYDSMKFKNYILCHELYMILIIIFQYLTRLYIKLAFYDIMKFILCYFMLEIH